MAVTSSHQPVRWAPDRLNGMFLTTIIAALCVALPILVVVSFVITGVSDAWPHLLDTLLGHYALNSLLLSMLVAVGVIMLGVPTAWIISFYRFRGRGVLSWLLLLPMAYPPSPCCVVCERGVMKSPTPLWCGLWVCGCGYRCWM